MRPGGPALAPILFASAAVPALAAEGATATVAAAIERGDEAVLWRLTRGAIYSKLTPEARSGVIVRVSPSELVGLTRGCSPEGPVEPGPSAGPFGSGMVSFHCTDRPVAGSKCMDVGYGLFVRPMGDYHRLEVWEGDHHSFDRCGMSAPPPPPLPSRARPN